MSRVILIYPGTTDFDDQARLQGELDLPLNDNGIEQVREMVPALDKFSLDAIYSAPEGAARQTADIIGSALGVRVSTSNDFRNLNQGLWQGLQIDEIRRKYPRVFKQWEESPETICPPDGETTSQATARLKKGLQKPLSKYKTIAVVAPDPAASLIRQIITGVEAHDTCPICSGRRGAGWEDLSANGISPPLSDELPAADGARHVSSLSATALPGAPH